MVSDCHIPRSACVKIKQMTSERVELYRRVPPLGETILATITPFLVDNLVPLEVEMEWAVRRLCSYRSDGPSEMRAEHLWGWLASATREDKPNATN